MSTRLFGVQVAHGFSPEARVFAGLLAHTDSAKVETQVVFQRAGELSVQRISPPLGEDAAERFRQAAGVPVLPLDFGWRSIARDRSFVDKARGRLQFLDAQPKAAALARPFQPDVIYSCQQLWDCQAATYLARRLRRPQIIHLHFVIGPWLHAPILKRLLTCDHVITVSDFIREEALRHGVAPDRVTTIRNTMALPPELDQAEGLAVRRELGIAEKAPLLGIVARLDPDKGQSDTLRAFAALRETHPAARLLIIGDETPWHPGYGVQLKREADVLGLGDSVLFLGRRSDVPRLLAALDIFVHPTRSDPCPLALLEASAAGLPVVAYAEGGAKEIVADGVSGLLAAAGDVQSLTAALHCLLADPRRAREIGRIGRARIAADFQPAPAGAAFVSVLEQVARRAGAQ